MRLSDFLTLRDSYPWGGPSNLWPIHPSHRSRGFACSAAKLAQGVESRARSFSLGVGTIVGIWRMSPAKRRKLRTMADAFSAKARRQHKKRARGVQAEPGGRRKPQPSYAQRVRGGSARAGTTKSAGQNCGYVIENYGAPGKTRTPNPQIRSLVLYPLSYGRVTVERCDGEIAEGGWPRNPHRPVIPGVFPIRAKQPRPSPLCPPGRGRAA